MMVKKLLSLLAGVFFTLLFSGVAYAQQFDDVAQNITISMQSLPGLIAAFAYLSGVVMGVSAIFKTVDHVSNPTQTPLRVPVIRFLIGGALFSLPIIVEAAVTSINGGVPVLFDPQGGAVAFLGSLMGVVSAFLSFGANVNMVLQFMIWSVEYLPALISATAYILGMVIAVSALYKTRDHVEDPQRVPVKDAVIRYITAGALFALPTVYTAMYETIASSGLGIFGTIASLIGPFGFLYSSQAGAIACGPTNILTILSSNGTIGDVLCTSLFNTITFSTFLNSISYLIGLVFGVWGILKVRDHVNDPSRVAISEGVTRLVAGGAFFALPFLIVVFQNTTGTAGIVASSFAVTALKGSNYGFNETLACGGGSNSLDVAMGCFMQDILGPSQIVLNFFTYVAGTIFIMIGISRLIKSSQEGPRGPGGVGTFGTFIVGAFLLSATAMIGAFSGSLFGTPGTFTYASLTYTTGMSAAEQQAALNVVSAVLKFMIIIGMLSFVRGMFILREVAEGSQQASTMSGVTHLVGGALAVNLGPLLNAIQSTLGITAFGVSFGTGL